MIIHLQVTMRILTAKSISEMCSGFLPLSGSDRCRCKAVLTAQDLCFCSISFSLWPMGILGNLRSLTGDQMRELYLGQSSELLAYIDATMSS